MTNGEQWIGGTRRAWFPSSILANRYSLLAPYPVIFAAVTTGSQRSALWRMSSRIWSGVEPNGTASSSTMRRLTSGIRIAVAIAAEIFAVMWAGVPGGAAIATQV